ncbi:MAG: S26 family signal peptidase [Spirochaetales bacterium]|nr:S26 family signal peptidase [Spirochaetales bacterium]
MDRWYADITHFTETILTWRKRRLLRKKAKQKKRHVIIEWLDAFLWAAFVVLLINQYLFQAYQIPTPSMENTLKISDRIFVNKLIYGPELLPGIVKLPGYRVPTRNKIIIFESPTYISKGTLFDIVQRILYMLTLSLVDIDRDENGQPRAHFLIKRAIGVAGDRLRIRAGEVELKAPGLGEWTKERALNPLHPIAYETQRMIKEDEYDVIRAAIKVREYRNLSIEPDPSEAAMVESSQSIKNDGYERAAVYNSTIHQINPHQSRYRSEYRRYLLGWYIPEGWIFPMGDNRDNSNDARYFGPVRLEKVLGKAMFIYWPLGRLGAAR